MKRPRNRSIYQAFNYPQEPFDSWFDRHPVISGALTGAVFVLLIWWLG